MCITSHRERTRKAAIIRETRGRYVDFLALSWHPAAAQRKPQFAGGGKQNTQRMSLSALSRRLRRGHCRLVRTCACTCTCARGGEG